MSAEQPVVTGAVKRMMSGKCGSFVTAASGFESTDPRLGCRDERVKKDE
jgi:hypothetical protein